MTMDLGGLGQFDVVLYLGVLYHMENPLQSLRRLLEATTPGGLAVIAYVVLWIILPEKTSLHLPPEEARRQSLGDIQSEAKQLGQEVQDIFGRSERQAAPSQRVLWLGGLLILSGLALLADNLHLLGQFRLEHLWPLVLILAGSVMLSRAIRK